jgi:hypothetical protein
MTRQMITVDQILRLALDPTSGPVPIGRITHDLSTAIGGAGTSVRISHQTLRKQLERHPDLKLQDYPFVRHILATGAAFISRPRCLSFIHAPPDRTDLLSFKAVVKAAANGELFLVSFHRLRQDEKRRLLRRAVLVRPFGRSE